MKDWGSGRPVILMSGWPLSVDSWDDQAMAIAESGYRNIAYDRLGGAVHVKDRRQSRRHREAAPDG